MRENFAPKWWWLGEQHHSYFVFDSYASDIGFSAQSVTPLLIERIDPVFGKVTCITTMQAYYLGGFVGQFILRLLQCNVRKRNYTPNIMLRPLLSPSIIPQGDCTSGKSENFLFCLAHLSPWCTYLSVLSVYWGKLRRKLSEKYLYLLMNLTY